jgi:protein SCO1/2
MTRLAHALTFVPIFCVLVSASVAAQEYPVTGMVLKVDRVGKSVVVSHDRIANLMEGMTMTFPVLDAKELEGLAPGAIVEFTLVVNKETSYATHVRVRRYESMEQDPLNARRLGLLNRINRGASQVPALSVGQAVPDFTLTNQASQRVSLSQFRGRVVALTFIYTACALPQFCLRSANNFGVLQKRFAHELGRNLILLTITFDPLRDRPEVLAQYASQWEADPRTWSFLTGEVPSVRRVCQLFGLDFFPNEGLMDHSVRTALIDRQGTLVANIEGNQFTAGQLGDLVRSVVSAAPPQAGEQRGLK